MLLDNIIPSNELTPYVKRFRIADFSFPKNLPLPFKAYPPRPQECLQFYPKDTERVSYNTSDTVYKGQRVSLIGQHTHVSNRYIGSDFTVIQVVFQPGVLYLITGIPAMHLVNIQLEAEEVLGSEINLINEQLFHAKSYSEMISVMEFYLRKLIRKINKKVHRIHDVAKNMLESGEHNSIDRYLAQACLSHRQFDRIFKERIGINPKLFSRLIRFDRAFRMKNHFPLKDWLTVALHSGYYDYQHLFKDYKEFTGFSPSEFFEIENGAPERSFGDVET